MTLPIFRVCAADTSVQSLLGGAGGVVRLFPFGEAPEENTRPYAVYQTVYGAPENYLGQTPDVDSYGIQVDSYAMTAGEASQVAKALRNAIEPFAHVVSWDGESRDAATSLYRYGFTVDWFVDRD